MEDKNMNDAERAIVQKRAALDAKEIENRIVDFYEAYKDTKYVQFSFDCFVFVDMEFVVKRATISCSNVFAALIETLKHSKNDKNDEKS